MINFAHRGASEYAPENTVLSFSLGLIMGANGIETDVRKSKDGVLYLYHDDTIDRMTDGIGNVTGRTYSELYKLNVIKNGLTDKILSFENFLKAFSHQDIIFAIETKEVGLEKELIELLDKYDMKKKTTITSFEFESIKNCKKIDPTYQVGYLVEELNDKVILDLKSIGGEEICPEAKLLTPEITNNLKAQGLRVRAWGIYGEQEMLHAIKCGVYGMTVNFPDKLKKYLDDNK